MGPLLLFGVNAASLTAFCKTDTEYYFCFSPLSIKVKNPLQISFREIDANVGFCKVKWHKVTQKSGRDAYMREL